MSNILVGCSGWSYPEYTERLWTSNCFVIGYYCNIEEKDPCVLIYRCHTSGCPVLIWRGSQRSCFYHRSPRLVAFGKSYRWLSL